MTSTRATDEIVFRGVRFEVKRTAFPRRDHGTMHREVVVPRDAVVIVPMLDDDTIVLIRNQRPAVGETLWELPAGTLEAGEDPAACAVRELAEESGYEAAKVTKLAEFYSSPGFCTELLTAYLATNLKHVGQKLDDTERIDVEPTPWPRALDMIRRNRIRDGKSIAAMLYHQVFRDQ